MRQTRPAFPFVPMSVAPRASERLPLRLLTTLDALCNRLYGWRYNPLYQSGTIVVALYLVLVATGVWLTVFYRVGAPWESVARINASPWAGSWARALHRYASDLAVLATIVHAVRMFAQARSWGPRTLAWISGVVLLLLVFVCGWTGYVMVWDTFGQYLAREGARMLDTVPVLSEPTSRAFTGEQPVPSAFFFLNLFAHIAIPLGMGVVFWIHLRRVARPVLLPPRPMTWVLIGGLTALAIVRPVPMAPEADPFVLPERIPADLFFAFWLPLSSSVGGGAALLAAAAIAAGFVVVPLFTKRRGRTQPEPSRVDEELCTGCVQCSLDCPYGAIEMRDRTGPRSPLVAHVNPSLCVSCGICAGSCPPMGVGPPGRTGRDQLARAREFIARTPPGGRVVVIGCERAAASFAGEMAAAGALPYAINCAGSLHTSIIELFIREGAGGVLVVACPPRDCWNREGPRWLGERVYHDREAELQARVDRARVRIAHANAGERRRALEALRVFQAEVAALGGPALARDLDAAAECEPAPVSRRRRWW
jgi:ferredoxin/coenzyme F420-reducing hydrogenase delta subunit